MRKKLVALAVEPKARRILRKVAAARRTMIYQLVLTLAEEAEKNLSKKCQD